MNTSNEKVLFAVDEQGVATVTLNNPDKHNAFDDEIIKQLTTIFNDISKREDISITVLASNGKSFSAGADLGWMKRMASYSYQDNLKDANALAQMLKALNFLPQTTIAKIQGAAFGGAVGLASCCDIVIASTKASFCLSEVKLGLIPATILANGSQARRKAKKLSQDVAFKTVDDALLTNTSERIAAIRVSEEGQEGLNAFFEKRLPNWQK